MDSLDKLQITDGVRYLTSGYIDYAEEVISERAIVNMYDGLKPVNRRILWTAKTNNCDKKFRKSQRLAGDTLGYHPHGDASIYKASIPMVDSRGAQAFPTLKGFGSFGNISSGESASAPRYTEEMLHPNSVEFFGELDGIRLIPNFDGTLSEPEVLPVSFPNVLVNASEGIAIGFSSKIPSFNFNDVMDLCIEYIDDGECHTEIYPDFVTRGYYIKNNKEIKKLMRAGKASIKLRGKATIQGKNILITEVPYGKSALTLKKEIENSNIQNIKSIGNVSDYTGAGLLIECKSKNAVDGVLYDIYKNTSFQYSYGANLVVVKDGSPKQMGVWSIIGDWVEWRKGVVERHLKQELDSHKKRMRECEAFMNLINLGDVKNEFVQRVSLYGRKEATSWLRPHIKDLVPDDLVEFVTKQRLDYYHTGGKFATQYEASKEELRNIETKLSDLDKTIRDQIVRLKEVYGSNLPRMTEVTTIDYEFESEKEEPIKDTSSCVYAVKNNFLKKLKYVDMSSEYDFQFEGTASDTLVAFDNLGRVLRINGQDIDIMSPAEMGLYLPRFLAMGDVPEDYRVMWMGVVDGSEKTLIYNDGTVGFLDTSEWLESNRQVRVLKNGVNSEAGNVVAVLDELPEALVALDSQGGIGWVDTSTIKHKFRTARTRVWSLRKGTVLAGLCCCSLVDVTVMLNNMSNYEAPRIRNLASADDYRGDGTEFMSL